MFIPLIDGYVTGLLLSIFILVPLIFAFIYLPLGIQNLLVGKREKSKLKTSSGAWAIGLAVVGIVIAYTAFIIIWKSISGT